MRSQGISLPWTVAPEKGGISVLLTFVTSTMPDAFVNRVQLQRDFQFYSSSVLIIYEGDATSAEYANVSIRLVDFAHTFPSQGQKDFNFLRGLLALSATLSNVLCLDYHDCLF